MKTYNLEISVPNTFTDDEIERLRGICKPYGEIVVEADTVTFPFFTTDGSPAEEQTKSVERLCMQARQPQPVSFPDHATVEEIRRQYPPNSRIVLDQMDDEYGQAPPIGSQGIVTGVDDYGSIMPNCDESGSQYIIYGVDKCHLVSTELEAEISLNHFGSIWRWGCRCPRCGKESPDGHLYALSRRARIQICNACGMLEALESMKANADIGKVYDKDIPGVMNRLDWAIMQTDWEK